MLPDLIIIFLLTSFFILMACSKNPYGDLSYYDDTPPLNKEAKDAINRILEKGCRKSRYTYPKTLDK
jgi:hypothetical protein